MWKTTEKINKKSLSTFNKRFIICDYMIKLRQREGGPNSCIFMDEVYRVWRDNELLKTNDLLETITENMAKQVYICRMLG